MSFRMVQGCLHEFNADVRIEPVRHAADDRAEQINPISSVEFFLLERAGEGRFVVAAKWLGGRKTEYCQLPVTCYTGYLMKISEDFRKFAAEQGVTEPEAVAKRMNEKSAEFKRAGSEI
jgi:hypothetical protein